MDFRNAGRAKNHSTFRKIGAKETTTPSRVSVHCPSVNRGRRHSGAESEQGPPGTQDESANLQENTTMSSDLTVSEDDEPAENDASIGWALARTTNAGRRAAGGRTALPAAAVARVCWRLRTARNGVLK